MRKILSLLLVFGLLSCNQQHSQELPDSPAVAMVGENKVTLDMLNAYLKANGLSNKDDALIKKALESLSLEIALANIAKNKNLSLNTEQLNTLEYLKIKTLANNAKSDYLSDLEVTEQEIQQEYQKGQKQAGEKQYHVHHLLYQDEVEAIKNRDQIKSAEDYKMLELLYSQQNPGIKNVGDIGWVALGQLPKGFREPLSKAKEDSILKQVVNTQFGAHIVYLEELRELKPPPLEQVKAGIIQSIKAKKLSKFIQLTKAKARIKIKK